MRAQDSHIIPDPRCILAKGIKFDTVCSVRVTFTRQRVEILSSSNIIGETLLSKVVDSGEVELFRSVWGHAERLLSPDEVGGESLSA